MTDSLLPDDSLGALVAEHRTSRSGFVNVFLLMIASLAIGLALLNFAIRAGSSEALGGRIILGILGVLFLLPTGLGVYGIARGRNNGVRVYDRGIVARDGNEELRARWEDIAGYSQGVFLELETKSGASIQVGMNGLRGGPELLSTLQRELGSRGIQPGGAFDE